MENWPWCTSEEDDPPNLDACLDALHDWWVANPNNNSWGQTECINVCQLRCAVVQRMQAVGAEIPELPDGRVISLDQIKLLSKHLKSIESSLRDRYGEKVIIEETDDAQNLTSQLVNASFIHAKVLEVNMAITLPRYVPRDAIIAEWNVPRYLGCSRLINPYIKQDTSIQSRLQLTTGILESLYDGDTGTPRPTYVNCNGGMQIAPCVPETASTAAQYGAVLLARGPHVRWILTGYQMGGGGASGGNGDKLKEHPHVPDIPVSVPLDWESQPSSQITSPDIVTPTDAIDANTPPKVVTLPLSRIDQPMDFCEEEWPEETPVESDDSVYCEPDEGNKLYSPDPVELDDPDPELGYDKEEPSCDPSPGPRVPEYLRLTINGEAVNVAHHSGRPIDVTDFLFETMDIRSPVVNKIKLTVPRGCGKLWHGPLFLTPAIYYDGPMTDPVLLYCHYCYYNIGDTDWLTHLCKKTTMRGEVWAYVEPAYTCVAPDDYAPDEHIEYLR